MFVYDAVRELLLLGDTSIKANDLKCVISQLKSKSDGKHSYQKQFDVSAWLMTHGCKILYSAKYYYNEEFHRIQYNKMDVNSKL